MLGSWCSFVVSSRGAVATVDADILFNTLEDSVGSSRKKKIADNSILFATTLISYEERTGVPNPHDEKKTSQLSSATNQQRNKTKQEGFVERCAPTQKNFLKVSSDMNTLLRTPLPQITCSVEVRQIKEKSKNEQKRKYLSVSCKINAQWVIDQSSEPRRIASLSFTLNSSALSALS